MNRIIAVVFAAAMMVALPFIFQRPNKSGVWRDGDPVLTVVSPHNEAIREEFAKGFSRWHEERYGKPVRIDWRVIGGTTEIMRYLNSEYIGSMKAWWERQGRNWPAAGGSWMLDRSYDPDAAPAEGLTDAELDEFKLRRELYLAFRTNDTPDTATAHMDVFFGGGVYDHSKAERQGMTVRPWASNADIPAGIFADERGKELIPLGLAGEQWRSDFFFGTVLSTFGICCNPDRLRDLGIEKNPNLWTDLADPRLFGNVGVTDPTKSGSVAKAFEMIVQNVCVDFVHAAGYTDSDIDAYEAAIMKAHLAPGALPDGVPSAYQRAVEDGWTRGMNLVRLIGANARYFTDSAGKVPIDVGMGATAAGISIDFFGRFQAEYTKTVDGAVRMTYATPVGGSCVSADPMSLLRGAQNRELGVRFIEYVLGPDGQKLWNSRVGTDGGPVRFALRRLPIRRDFYPSEDPVFDSAARARLANASDDLASSEVNPFKLAGAFTYRERWSGRHFGIQRDLIRAMCLDSGDELRKAWRTIIDNGGPNAPENAAAMEMLMRLPEKPVSVNWISVITDYNSISRLEYMRAWTSEMRANYRLAARLAKKNDVN